MPKLPLDRSALRKLPEAALGALRHPRRTAAQIVSGSRSAAGHVLDLRHGLHLEGPGRPEGAEPPGPVAAAPPTTVEATDEPTDDTIEDTVADLSDAAPAAEGVTEAATDDLGDPDDTEDTDVHPEGPAPHMPPRIAGAVERDYADDIPGITNGDR